MEGEYIAERSVDGAVKYILRVLQDDYYRDKKIIYCDDWNGLGAVPVLRSIAQRLLSTKASRPSELNFDKIIYLDCSAWESRRMMQRKIAEELKLGHTTMKVFDTQDEEDDFNGVDHGSRDVIQSASALIFQALRDKKFMMIFINGSDDEIDIISFGIPAITKFLSNRLIWTFNRRFLTVQDSRDKTQHKLRDTDLFLWDLIDRYLSFSDFQALLLEEATSIVARHPCLQGMEPTMVTDCCLYTLFLKYNFHSTTGFDWTAHASNYWMCVGMTKRDIKSETVNVLHKEICWKCYGTMLEQLCEKFMLDPKAPFLAVKDHIKNYQIRPFRWVCITLEYLTKSKVDLLTILETTSSLFVVLERSNDPPKLSNGLFKQCNNLVVLTLCFCIFSFVSPPFLECQGIKFLGLEHCTDNQASKRINPNNWAHLRSVLVLDIRNTDWDDILSQEKLKIMDNLMELNIEGFKCWQYISQLQNKLPHLEKLRIIKPIHESVVPLDIKNSFMDMKMLQVLDLSGNRGMKNLPRSITSTSNLEVLILDGCDELEAVVLSSEWPASSLRSFSFDGYGPTTQWKSMVELPPKSSRPEQPCVENTRDVIKTLKISLQGFKHLENLFLRGLPNLEELDLSGSSIKILDFNTMVVHVPNLKRLFLLGCEHLRAIRWVSDGDSIVQPKLELLCIDTHPGWSSIGCVRPSLDDKHKSFKLQVHAIIMDARLARSLSSIITSHSIDIECVYFNIRITETTGCVGFVEQEASDTEIVGPKNQPDLVLANQYADVSQQIDDAKPSSMEAFPQSPCPESDHHIEIGDGSRSIGSEIDTKANNNLWYLMAAMAESLNVHDSSNISRLAPEAFWRRLRWCRVARCPNIDTIFSPWSDDYNNKLETIWASELLKARCIWSKGGGTSHSFRNLQHLHLRSCPRLRFVLPVWVPSFPNLRTLHIIHCYDLGHVFVLDDGPYQYQVPIRGVPFPKLTTIHLYDLPKLRQISERRMLAPALKTIKIRGCFSLRRLPSLEGRQPGVEKPTIEIEKDVWNALKWDGLAAGHHPDLFQPPVHSRHYRRRLLRTSVLR